MLTYALDLSLLIFGGVGAFCFPIVYGFSAKWWGNPIGRMLMGLSFVICLVYVKWIVTFFLTHMLNVTPVNTIINGVVACAMWGMTATIWRVIRVSKLLKKKRATNE